MNRSGWFVILGAAMIFAAPAFADPDHPHASAPSFSHSAPSFPQHAGSRYEPARVDFGRLSAGSREENHAIVEHREEDGRREHRWIRHFTANRSVYYQPAGASSGDEAANDTDDHEATAPNKFDEDGNTYTTDSDGHLISVEHHRRPESSIPPDLSDGKATPSQPVGMSDTAASARIEDGARGVSTPQPPSGTPRPPSTMRVTYAPASDAARPAIVSPHHKASSSVTPSPEQSDGPTSSEGTSDGEKRAAWWAMLGVYVAAGGVGVKLVAGKLAAMAPPAGRGGLKYRQKPPL